MPRFNKKQNNKLLLSNYFNKSYLSRCRQIAEFDLLTVNFRLTILSAIFFGTSSSVVRKQLRIKYSFNKACSLLHSNSSWQHLNLFDFIITVQKHFNNCRLILFSKYSGKNIIYSGPSLKNINNIYLVESETHRQCFNFLYYPASYFKFKFFCERCLKFSRSKKLHQCFYLCTLCEDYCGAVIRNKMCKLCNRTFKNNLCFNNHITSNLCKYKKKCLHCNFDYIISKHSTHICLKDQCNRCFIAHDLGKCYVLTGKENIKNKTKILNIRPAIYFDIETIQLDNNTLEPILLICAYITHTDYQLHFKTFNRRFFVISDFIDFLFTKDSNSDKYTFENYVCIAHNLSGFDGIFIVEELYNRLYFKVKVIYNGTKLQMLTVLGIKLTFLDSLNFVHCSLRNLSKMFGEPMQKTFFPYKLLNPNNLEYVGKLPSIDKYDIDNLKNKDECNDFFKFYNEQKLIFKHKQFNLKSVLHAYCKIDVIVLVKCMEKFRLLIREKTNFDPFERDITLAGICLRDFIFNHLEPYSIGIIPAKSYFSCSNQSNKALDFLAFKSFELKTQIQTAHHPKGEYKIGPYFVDGITFDKKIIFDFNGCYFHGCPFCFSYTDYNTFNKTNMKQLYSNTRIRENNIRHIIENTPALFGFTYLTEWEHNWEKIKQTQLYTQYLQSTKQKVLNNKTNSIISDRGFFFGGRVNAIQFYLKKTDKISICYKDICSLYPYINKYKSYGKGHPIILTENFNLQLDFYWGIIKCKILPPQNLFHPVLPSKINNKLMFVLCYTCAKLESTVACHHNEEERVLYGEWCTPELYAAMKRGYKLIEIYCVFHFEKIIEYKNENESGLFGKYIDKWLKTKIENTGFPSIIKTQKQKDDFIMDYKIKENITLDPMKIEFNVGMRSLAKLFCNTLWGRISMGTDKTLTVIIDVNEFVNMTSNSAVDITFYAPLKGNRVLVCYKRINEGIIANEKGNVIVGAFVTAWARLHLFEELEKLGDRVAYLDTDSLIFTHQKGEYEPPSGDKLGEWVNEIPENVEIEEYVATGPKSYALRLSNGEVRIKSKGISQNLNNSSQLSFHSMKESVDQMIRQCSSRLAQGIIIENSLNFVRNKVDCIIKNIPNQKCLTFNYNKRVKYADSDNMYITYPYGYVMK